MSHLAQTKFIKFQAKVWVNCSEDFIVKDWVNCSRDSILEEDFLVKVRVDCSEDSVLGEDWKNVSWINLKGKNLNSKLREKANHTKLCFDLLQV